MTNISDKKNISMQDNLILLSIEAELIKVEENCKKKYFDEYNKTFGELEDAYNFYMKENWLDSNLDKEKIKNFIKYILLTERKKVFNLKEINDNLVKQNDDLINNLKETVNENQELRTKFKLKRTKF